MLVIWICCTLIFRKTNSPRLPIKQAYLLPLCTFIKIKQYNVADDQIALLK